MAERKLWAVIIEYVNGDLEPETYYDWHQAMSYAHHMSTWLTVAHVAIHNAQGVVVWTHTNERTQL